MHGSPAPGKLRHLQQASPQLAGQAQHCVHVYMWGASHTSSSAVVPAPSTTHVPGALRQTCRCSWAREEDARKASSSLLRHHMSPAQETMCTPSLSATANQVGIQLSTEARPTTFEHHCTSIYCGRSPVSRCTHTRYVTPCALSYHTVSPGGAGATLIRRVTPSPMPPTLMHTHLSQLHCAPAHAAHLLRGLLSWCFHCHPAR